MKIAVIGLGYVGLSNAILLAQSNEVVAVDTNNERVDLVNRRMSPIVDKDIEEYLENQQLNLKATSDAEHAYQGADIIIISTPTNYDEVSGQFDTSSVDSVIESATLINPEATIIVKSTIPVGYVEKARTQFSNQNIIFSPEFLREGKALYDNLHPSRIIVGDTNERAHEFAALLKEASLDKNTPVLFMSSTEAEAVKLFANTYLAMRVAFFNELDTYAEMKNLNSANIISGISLDPRIGDYYNNPSFGYGGYCLPKDTKQLLANYVDVPNDLIRAIVEANTTRIHHIAHMILRRAPEVVGVHRLAMKNGSDNFRQSSIQSVIKHLRLSGVEVVLYEPMINEEYYDGMKVINDIVDFKNISDIILANRHSVELDDVSDKVYTRDVFTRD